MITKSTPRHPQCHDNRKTAHSLLCLADNTQICLPLGIKVLLMGTKKHDCKASGLPSWLPVKFRIPLFVSLKCLAPSYLPELLWVHTPAGADKLLLDIPNMLALIQRGFGLLNQYFTAFLHFTALWWTLPLPGTLRINRLVSANTILMPLRVLYIPCQ